MTTTLTYQPTPTLVISLSTDEANRVAYARRLGLNLDAMLGGLLSGLPTPDADLKPNQTFAEILAPVHAHTKALGCTEEEIEALVDEEVDAYKREKRAELESQRR